jgi:hypothetical protein
MHVAVSPHLNDATTVNTRQINVNSHGRQLNMMSLARGASRLPSRVRFCDEMSTELTVSTMASLSDDCGRISPRVQMLVRQGASELIEFEEADQY